MVELAKEFRHRVGSVIQQENCIALKEVIGMAEIKNPVDDEQQQEESDYRQTSTRNHC